MTNFYFSTGKLADQCRLTRSCRTHNSYHGWSPRNLPGRSLALSRLASSYGGGSVSSASSGKASSGNACPSLSAYPTCDVTISHAARPFRRLRCGETRKIIANQICVGVQNLLSSSSIGHTLANIQLKLSHCLGKGFPADLCVRHFDYFCASMSLQLAKHYSCSSCVMATSEISKKK